MQSVGLCVGKFYLLACAVLLSVMWSRAVAAQAAQVTPQATVETSEQTNERIRVAAAAASHVPAPTEYVIGTGDLIAMQVFDVPELTRDLRVSQTGTIGIPLIPVRLHVAGLTESQAERKIEEVLEANGLVSHPEVNVTVREKKSRPITVVGAVTHPMVYSADRQVTLVEVLAEAGGIGPDAGDQVIITRTAPAPGSTSEPPAINSSDEVPPHGQEVTPSAGTISAGDSPSTARSASASDSSSSAPANEQVQPEPPQLTQEVTSSTITVNLGPILEGGNMSSNIVLLPGDVVTVPHAGVIYVLGAVGRPGGYTVTGDRAQLTTLKLLSLAGGMTGTAKSSHAYIVRKDESGKQREVEVDLKKVMKFQSEDVQLRPSDILYVPTSGPKVVGTHAAGFATALVSGVLLYRVAYR
jgi:polysaccharide export outer membrane protein